MANSHLHPLDAIRSKLLQLLVDEMNASFESLQRQIAEQGTEEGESAEATTEAELESLIRQARRKVSKADAARRRKRRR